MSVQTIYCVNSNGTLKARFSSARQAHRALVHSRLFRSRRFPVVYHCPCGAYHLTTGHR